jgi:hypothetical protein
MAAPAIEAKSKNMQEVGDVEKDNSISNADSEQYVLDAAAEKKLVAKLDRRIVPVIMLLYLFAFLDRYVEPIHEWSKKKCYCESG